MGSNRSHSRYTPTTMRGGLAQCRNRGKFARKQREYREPTYPVTPAPRVSAEQMAQQLASDPEFEQWAFTTRHYPRSLP